MKAMACKQFGGVCDEVFHSATFDEIAELSKKHAMEMFSKGDKAHLISMNDMKKRMENPEAIQNGLL
jgi:hypothetical protein